MCALQFTESTAVPRSSGGRGAEPHAGPGQIRIVVKAASVNPFDWKLRSGMYARGKPLEGRVSGPRRLPGWSTRSARGSPGLRSATTSSAWGATPRRSSRCWTPGRASTHRSTGRSPERRARAETSERVLRLLGVKARETPSSSTAARAGSGSAAAQFAVARGVTVIASASEDNQGYLREIGAIPVRLRRRSGGPGRAASDGQVDAVLDAVGQDADRGSHRAGPGAAQVVSIANFGAARLARG